MTSRTNANATRPPTAIDAEDKGYGVGSRWYDVLHGRNYTCRDGTKNAAIWIEDYADVTDAESVRAAGAIVSKSNLDAIVAPTVNDDSGESYEVSSRWFDITADKEYVCLDATVGAAVWIETTGTAGAGLWESASSITKLTTAENINIQQKELIAAAFETLTTVERGALSPVTSQLCYDTDESHLYINI